MLFGLTCDFIQRDGICMKLDEPGGLSADKLNRVQLQMMVSSMIPNHLRLYLKELDLKISLEYALSGKKMLSHLLKSEKLDMNAFFGLLLQIAQGMEEGRLYMLEPGMYALHEDYIFIEGTLQNGKLYLTYVPLKSPTAAAKPGERLRALIMVLMAAVTELRGDGVQRLLHYCGEEGFTSAGLKALLAELLTGNDSVKSVLRNDEIPAQGKTTVERFIHEKAREQATSSRVSVELPQEDKKEIAGWMNTYSSLRSKENSNEVSSFSIDDSVQDNEPSSLRVYIAMGCLLVDALLWKLIYINHPSFIVLIVCTAATVVLSVLTGLVWFGFIKLRRSEEDEVDDVEKPVFTSAHALVDMPRYEPDQRLPFRSMTPAFNSGEVHVEGNQQQAKALPPVAPTALLSREKAPRRGQELGQQHVETPYLERMDEELGQTEKIELNRPSFIIGRSTEVAQYIERSDGASRVHAEISKSTGGYVLKDLDSRNGTFLQGEAMIPYKEYRLEEGDTFTIVKGCYTFHTA